MDQRLCYLAQWMEFAKSESCLRDQIDHTIKNIFCIAYGTTSQLLCSMRKISAYKQFSLPAANTVFMTKSSEPCCALIKKENKIFLIYKEIQMGSGEKSYMRKGFLIYEEIRKYFPHIWGLEAVLVTYDFAPDSS